MNKKIIFVEPRGAKSNVFAKYMNLPLLGTLYLATLLKNKGYDVEVINENILGRDILESELFADFLCISIITNTAPRGYSIAETFRRLNPEGIIIFGGIHATFLPDEAKKHGDFVVQGEGEFVITDIIEGKYKPGIITGQRVENLDEIPIYDITLIKNYEKISIFPLMFSRGCPFSCNFCSVTQMFGKKYRTHSEARIIEELKRAPNDIFIYDDNFAANPKRTKSLLDSIIKLERKFDLSIQARTDITKYPDIVSKMREAGIKRVYIGIESINERSLESMKKQQTLDDIKRAISVFHENDIKVHGMFIFGTDNDTANVFPDTVKFCKNEGIETVQYVALTPLPGTIQYQEMEQSGRLLHKNWEYYDGQHVVFKPKNMSAQELQSNIIDSYKQFYSYISMVDEVFLSGYKFVFNLPDGISNAFSNLKFKLLGRIIVNKWLKSNLDYIEKLKFLDF